MPEPPPMSLTKAESAGSEATGSSGPMFVEYPIGGPATLWWSVADALLVGVIASGVVILPGIALLVGIVDEHALGYDHHRALDHWSRAWLAMDTVGGILGLGLLALIATTIARMAIRRRLADVGRAPSAANRIPVTAQARILDHDPLEPARLGARKIALTLGGLAGLMAIVGFFVVVNHHDEVRYLLITVGALLGPALISFAIYQLLRARPATWTTAGTPWDERGALSARKQVRDIRREQRRTTQTRLSDRIRMAVVGRGQSAVLAIGAVWGIAVLVMVFVRKPGRRSPTIDYSEPIEHKIELTWRILLLVAAATLILMALTWLLVLVLDAVRLVGLVRAARRSAGARPPDPVLRVLLRSPGLTGRVGRAMVAIAVIIAAGLGAMVLKHVGPTDRAVIGLWLTAVAAVVGVLLIAFGVSRERRWRELIRAQWPIIEPPIAASSGLSRRRKDTGSDVDLDVS